MGNDIIQKDSDGRVTFKEHYAVIFGSIVLGYVIAIFSGLSLNTAFSIFLLPVFAIPVLVSILILAAVFNFRKLPWKSDLLTAFLFIIVLNIWNITNQPKPDNVAVPYDFKPALAKYYLGDFDKYSQHLTSAANLTFLYCVLSLAYIISKKKVNAWLIIVPGVLVLLYTIF